MHTPKPGTPLSRPAGATKTFVQPAHDRPVKPHAGPAPDALQTLPQLRRPVAPTDHAVAASIDRSSPPRNVTPCPLVDGLSSIASRLHPPTSGQRDPSCPPAHRAAPFLPARRFPEAAAPCTASFRRWTDPLPRCTNHHTTETPVKGASRRMRWRCAPPLTGVSVVKFGIYQGTGKERCIEKNTAE